MNFFCSFFPPCTESTLQVDMAKLIEIFSIPTSTRGQDFILFSKLCFAHPFILVVFSSLFIKTYSYNKTFQKC
jgi:hypothetical protein